MRLLRSQKTRFGFLLLLCAAALAVGGCGSSSDDSSGGGSGSESSEATAFEPAQEGGIEGALLPEELDLWKYNFDTGKYEVVPGDASKPFAPAIEKFAAGTKLGYIDPWAANPFAIPIREGFEALGREYGFEVVYCDTAFKPEKAVECAEEVSGQGPEFVVAGNWQVGAAPAMMKVLDEARIPAASIDVSEPNAVFVGADNYSAGEIAGKAAGEFAQKEWNCEDVWVLLGENLAEGEAADLRMQGFEDGVQEVCGELPGDQIERLRLASATGDQALTATTDWLTAHPQAQHIVGTSLDDERASGIAKSFVQAGVEGYGVGMGCDTVGIETMRQAPPEENHFLGCAAFFPEKYAELLVEVAQSVLADEAVPNEVHVAHEFIDSATVDQYYPE